MPSGDRPSQNEEQQARCSYCGKTGTYYGVWQHCRQNAPCKAVGAYSIGIDGLYTPQPNSMNTPDPPSPTTLPTEGLPTGDDAIRSAERILGGRERRDDSVVSNVQNKSPEPEPQAFEPESEEPAGFTMAELAAGMDDGGDDEFPPSLYEEEPEHEWDGQPVAPTILTRDGTVSLPAHMVAFFDACRGVGYTRSLRDFVVEWMTVGIAVSGIDVRLLPIGDDERTQILRALGINLQEVAV